MLLVGIIIGLILCELILRWNEAVLFNFKDMRNFRIFLYQHEDMGWFSKDPILYWRFNAGSFRMGGKGEGQLTPFKINSNGLRGPEIPTEKPANTFRIVCLGDSTTFGWIVKYELTYEQLLQSLLNAKSKRLNFEVINAGVPGYTACQGYNLLDKYFKRWKPDMVTIYFGSNDCYDAKTFYREIENNFFRRADEALRERSHFYSFLKKRYLYFKIQNRLKHPNNKEPIGIEYEYRDYLESIIDLARRNNIKPVLLTYPTYVEVYGNARFTYNQIVLEVARKKNCPVVDLVDAFKNANKEILFYDDVHPGPSGYKIIAQELEKVIHQELHLE